MTPSSALSRLEKLAEEYASARYHRVDTNWQLCKQNFMEVAKSVLSLLSEPGEASGPRAILGTVDYCDLRELLQARAAHELELADIQRDGEQMIAQISTAMQKVVVERDAERAALASSEARVRIISEAMEKIAELQGSPIKSSAGWAGQVARQALLEVQR